MVNHSERFNCGIGGSLETIDEKSKSELECETISGDESQVRISKDSSFQETNSVDSSAQEVKCFMCNLYILKRDA